MATPPAAADPAVTFDPLPYHDRLATRPAEAIDLVVIHCTELPDLATARVYGERVIYADTGTGASGHHYIDRDGSIACWVDLLRTANHTRGWNPRSIGIELVNRGRFPDWYATDAQMMTEPYPAAQIDALVDLLAALARRLPKLRWIAGHEDLDTAWVAASDDPGARVRRKLDPGPMFPWAALLARIPLARLPVEPATG
jgi:N-acetylmuramoyl-L-alanine amidase